MGSQLVASIAGVAAIPRSRDVLDAALKLVVTMAQAVVIGADGVSITLPRNGRFGTVAASNDVVLEMDHDQYDTGEGPCLDAAIQGERFHIDALGEESRWPAFVPRARARGIESILSTPLVAGGGPDRRTERLLPHGRGFRRAREGVGRPVRLRGRTVVSSAQPDRPGP